MAPDEQRFLDAVREHWRRLQLIARHYAASEADRQDLVQETLLRAWRNVVASGPKPVTAAWLCVILRNVAWEWHRSAAGKLRLRLVADTELTELMAPDPGDPLAALPALSNEAFRERLDDRLAAAFDELDAPCKEVLILSVAGDLTYREIAEVLDCPLGTVMSRMARARRLLRERLARLLGSRRISQEARS